MDRTSRSISLPNQHANNRISNQSVSHLNPPSRSSSLKKVTFDKGLNHSLSQSFDRPINQSNNQTMPHSFVEVEDENPVDAPEYDSSDDMFYHSNNQQKDSFMQTALYHRHDDDQPVNQSINESFSEYKQSNGQLDDEPNFHSVTQAINLFKESEPDYESKYIDHGQSVNQPSHKSQHMHDDHYHSSTQSNNRSITQSDDEARRCRMEKYQNYAAVAEPLYSQSNNQMIDESIKPIIESNNQFLNDYDQSTNQSINQSHDVAFVDPHKLSSIVAQALPQSNNRSFNQSNNSANQLHHQKSSQQVNQPDDQSVNQSVNHSVNRSASLTANLFAPSINVFDGEIGVGSGYGKGRGRVSINTPNNQTNNQSNKLNNQSGSQSNKQESNYQSINQTSTQEQHKPGRKLFARHNQTTQQSISQPHFLSKSATSAKPSTSQSNNQLNNPPNNPSNNQTINQTSPASILHAQIAHLQSEVQKYESARAELESDWNEKSRELKFMAQEQKARETRFENERKEFLIFQEKETKKLKNERIKLDKMKRELTGLPPRADRVAIEKLQSLNQSMNQEFKVKEEQYKSQINLLRQQLKQSINQTKELREQRKMVEKERVYEWQKQSTKSVKQSNNQSKPTIAFGSRSIKQSNTINQTHNQINDDAAKERKARISEALKATIMDRSLDQPNDPSCKQSANQSKNHQSTSPLAISSTNEATDDSINPSNNPSSNQSNCRTNNQFNFDPSLIVQSINQNGKTEHRLIDGSRVIDFPNGTRKLIDCSMNSRTEFANGDWKEDRNIQSNDQSDDGVQTIYYYAARGILETRLIDGTIRYQFNNGQLETHLVDGSKEIVFEDGNRVLVNEAGEVIDD